MLIDGGLVNNLPTDVVREMGAEVVIAVVLESAPADAKQLTTIGNILKQSVSVAVLQNERRKRQNRRYSHRHSCPRTSGCWILMRPRR